MKEKKSTAAPSADGASAPTPPPIASAVTAKPPALPKPKTPLGDKRKL